MKKRLHRADKNKKKEDQKKLPVELHKIEHAINKTHGVVYQIKTVFPFYIFPVTILIDEEKVSIIYTNFFFSKQITQILLKDIKSVQLEADIFFAKMQINTAPPVSFLWKNKAFKARRIVEGMVVIANEGIDTSLFNTEELRKKAEEIGKANEIK